MSQTPIVQPANVILAINQGTMGFINTLGLEDIVAKPLKDEMMANTKITKIEGEE